MLRVLDATRELVLERGYAGAAMKDIADRAGVSTEWVYKSFGTKPALVKRTFDVALVGDDEPIPLSERPEIQAIRAEPDARAKLVLYARLARQLLERTGPLLVAILASARTGHPDLQEFVATTNGERLIGATNMATEVDRAGGLRAGLTVAQARDIVWTLIAPENYQLLVIDRGWDLDAYEGYLARALVDALCGGPVTDDGS